MKSKTILSAALLFAASLCAQNAAPLPVTKQNGAVKQLFVDNKPFIMLSGELRNSTASSVEYMKPVWDNLAALHLNTVIGTVSWELMEPAKVALIFHWSTRKSKRRVIAACGWS